MLIKEQSWCEYIENFCFGWCGFFNQEPPENSYFERDWSRFNQTGKLANVNSSMRETTPLLRAKKENFVPEPEFKIPSLEIDLEKGGKTEEIQDEEPVQYSSVPATRANTPRSEELDFEFVEEE